MSRWALDTRASAGFADRPIVLPTRGSSPHRDGPWVLPGPAKKAFDTATPRYSPCLSGLCRIPLPCEAPRGLRRYTAIGWGLGLRLIRSPGKLPALAHLLIPKPVTHQLEQLSQSNRAPLRGPRAVKARRFRPGTEEHIGHTPLRPAIAPRQRYAH